MRYVRWELRFWVAGQILMLLLAPLVGHFAAWLWWPNYMGFAYTCLVVMLWPMGPMLYTLVFRPEVI